MGLFGDGEGLLDLRIRVENRRDPPAGNGSKLGVVLLDGEDVVAARHGNAIFGAFKLGLQRQEVLIGFEVGILFRYDQQARQRPSQRGLIRLELLERLAR